MDQDQIELLRRVAQAAKDFRAESGQLQFRAQAHFARVLTPEVVIELCDLALRRSYADKETGR